MSFTILCTSGSQVPLADILSNYMEELQHIEVTFDGGQTSVNFAQVACYRM